MTCTCNTGRFCHVHRQFYNYRFQQPPHYREFRNREVNTTSFKAGGGIRIIKKVVGTK